MGQGEITDDSEMAMCIMHGLSHDNSEQVTRARTVTKASEQYELNLDRICLFFRKWINSGPFDVGMTTRTALKAININRLNPSESIQSSYQHTRASESNGCLMRITPLAVWGHKLPKEQLYQAVKLQTSLTHSNQIAIDASYLYCYAIVLLINGKTAK